METTRRRGGEDPSGGISSMCERGRNRKGRGRNNKEDDNNGYEVNGDEFNGEVLQWRAATRNGSALTLEGYN